MGAAARRGEDFDPAQLDELDELYRATLEGRGQRRPRPPRAAAPEGAVDAGARADRAQARRGALVKQVRGRQVVERVHEVVGLDPGEATVLVVRRGDESSST